MSEGKVAETHRRRRAVVYVRQSTLQQVERNTESAARQYALRERALELGWAEDAISIVDEDTGRSGASSQKRIGLMSMAIGFSPAAAIQPPH
jgi:DNA invertase Pin-like site-specific DNA recombinase